MRYLSLTERENPTQRGISTLFAASSDFARLTVRGFLIPLPIARRSLPQRDSCPLQFKPAIAPDISQIQIAGEPHCKPEQVAQRIEPWCAPYLRISNHYPAHQARLDQAVQHSHTQQQCSKLPVS